MRTIVASVSKRPVVSSGRMPNANSRSTAHRRPWPKSSTADANASGVVVISTISTLFDTEVETVSFFPTANGYAPRVKCPSSAETTLHDTI